MKSWGSRELRRWSSPSATPVQWFVRSAEVRSFEGRTATSAGCDTRASGHGRATSSWRLGSIAVLDAAGISISGFLDRPVAPLHGAFRRQIFANHHHGISQKTLAERERLGSATVERWYQELLELKVRERQDASCPRILGIDEHFFSRKDGFATTLCDLGKHRVFDVLLGRSEKALEGDLGQLLGKDQVRVVCMDLATSYRSIVRKHFPKALIVADRFHVIRLVNQQFLASWSQLDPKGRTNRGLLSLVRRHAENLKPDQRHRLMAYLDLHPAFRVIYQFKQRLCGCF